MIKAPSSHLLLSPSPACLLVIRDLPGALLRAMELLRPFPAVFAPAAFFTHLLLLRSSACGDTDQP